MYARIKSWFATGKWTAEQVQAAADKNWITQEQADDILTAPGS